MRNAWVLLLATTLAACESAPVIERPDGLFQDDLFAAPSVRISAADVFALSPEMRRYVHVDIAGRLHSEGPQRGLVAALYDKNELKLDYDAQETRNAAGTFAAKAGNCLSLVIMTAAFAKELRMPVRYQKVLVDNSWSRSGDFYFSSGHVNLTLGVARTGTSILDFETARMTVDFLGAEDVIGRRVVIIKENTVVAMYMNNRAAEALAQGQVNDAYWWARAAIGQDPGFLNSYDTLGVVYLRHGNLPPAERALNRALEHEPENPQVMSNLAVVLNAEGRVEEANTLTRKLEQLQPYPPFHFFDLGMTAMRNGDYQAAKRLFSREVERDPYYHEFHFWLAVADFNLGDLDHARAQLALAMEYSPSPKQHAVYAAKLDRIRALHPE
jgi:Tfp pilus assembly protein PilF